MTSQRKDASVTAADDGCEVMVPRGPAGTYIRLSGLQRPHGHACTLHARQSRRSRSRTVTKGDIAGGAQVSTVADVDDRWRRLPKLRACVAPAGPPCVAQGALGHWLQCARHAVRRPAAFAKSHRAGVPAVFRTLSRRSPPWWRDLAVPSVDPMIEASGGAAPAGGIAGWAAHLMESLGAPGAGLANAVDTVLPFVPSEVILPLAGFTAGQGRMSLAAAIVWATLGSVLGSLVVYGAGALLGRERVRAIAERIPLVRVHEIDRAEAWFARYGAVTVFLARMVPVLRSLISVPAGVERMPVLTFVALTSAGSLIWNTVFVLAGYWLGDNWRLVEEYGGLLSKAVVVAVIVAVVWFVASRLTRSGALHRS